MTKCNTIIQIPYEGCMIREHETKEEAEKQYVEDCKEVEEGSLIGCALASIEVVKEKGDWK